MHDFYPQTRIDGWLSRQAVDWLARCSTRGSCTVQAGLSELTNSITMLYGNRKRSKALLSSLPSGENEKSKVQVRPENSKELLKVLVSQGRAEQSRAEQRRSNVQGTEKGQDNLCFSKPNELRSCGKNDMVKV